MSTFVVNTNSLFLCGNTNGSVSVVDAGSDLNISNCASDNWKVVATAIGTLKTMTITVAAGTKVCRALEIFGTVIEGQALDKLGKDLLNSQVLANRDGYQVRYSGVDGGGINGAGFVIGNSYLMKLNNLFGWREYGVKSPEGRIAATVWNRYDMSIGEAVVDYVAAEAKAREMESELRESEKRAAEKEEMLGHYKRILEENKELVKEIVDGKNRLREVLEEKKGMIEEQRRVINEKEVQIEGLMKLKEKVVNDDDGGGEGLKAAMESALRDLNRVVRACKLVFFVSLLMVTLLILSFAVCGSIVKIVVKRS